MDARGCTVVGVHAQGLRDNASRNRRAHKKSRQGCRNCKLRSVKVSNAVMSFLRGRVTNARLKCDETKPNCKKCTTFRVTCNYDSKAPDLQTCFDGMTSIKDLQEPSPPTNQASLVKVEVPAWLRPAPIIMSDHDSTFQLDGQIWDRLARFRTRTVLSVGSIKAAELCQNIAVELACSVRLHINQTRDLH